MALNKCALTASDVLTIGLAMLLGARYEHKHALLRAAACLDLEIDIRELRKSSDIEGIDGLV